MLTSTDSLTSRNQTVLGILNSRRAWEGVGSFGIEGTKQILNLLGDPQNSTPAIVVGGTNGKGSVCTMLASILMTKYSKVAQFASPNLHHYTERLLIQGKPIDENRLLSAIDQVLAKEGTEIQLSFFELIIAASFLVCSEDSVDWMVVEVGLGGRLDATNVIDKPRATVITSIGLDHTAVLGNTETLISREKAGIFREEVPAFIGVVSEEAKIEILECSRKAGCQANFIDEVQVEDPLVPQYRANNLALTRRVATALGFTETEIQSGISNAFWPGRLEPVKFRSRAGEQSIILDGAHNPDGIKGLTDFLSRSDAKKFVILISILATKDASTMISILKSWAQGRAVKFLFCKMRGHVGVEPEALQSQMGYGDCVGSIEDGLRRMEELVTKDVLCVITGSLYFIGEARGILVDKPFTTVR